MHNILPIIITLSLLTLTMNVSADPTPHLHITPLIIPNINTTRYTTLTLSEAPNGLAGYNLTITIHNPTLATITNIILPTWAALNSQSTLPAATCWIKAIDLNSNIQPGTTNITLLTLGITGHAIGNTTINITLTKMDDDNGQPMIPNIDNATLQIVSNHPPNQPTNPTPANGSNNQPTTLTLSVFVSDPDKNPLTVQFINTKDGSIISTVNTIQSNTTASTTWSGLTQGTTYSWYTITNDSFTQNISTIWSFTTKKKTSGGGGGGIPPTNLPPIADLSAGEPYTGYINEQIRFNATKSTDDGYIQNYSWDYGDHTKGFNIITTHTYSKPGTYTVILTVTDDQGLKATDQTTIIILQPNKPPNQPIIIGPQLGTQHTTYNYTLSSHDEENDALQYFINWGDNTTTITNWIENSTEITLNHIWNNAGIFHLTIYAKDIKNATSNQTYLIILIDAHYCEHLGFFLDINSDTIYDQFYSNITQSITLIEFKNNHYYIDSNTDGSWDYTYSQPDGLIPFTNTVKTPGFEFLTMIFVLLATIIIYSRVSKSK